MCANGLVCGRATDDLRIKHTGNVHGEVVQGALSLVANFDQVDAAKDAMKSTILTTGEQTAFARAALALRFGTDDEPPVSVVQTLSPRRREDEGESLWNTLQRTQENLVRGGLRTHGRDRRWRTRPVRGIDGNLALNRALWVLADEMHKLQLAH